MDKKSKSNLCAILSYLLIGVIWYFVDEKMKKDTFVKFHVKQGIILIIFAILWSIVLNIVSFALFYLAPIIIILGYVPLIFTIIGIINAINRKEHELPIIGIYAKKLTF